MMMIIMVMLNMMKTRMIKLKMVMMIYLRLWWGAFVLEVSMASVADEYIHQDTNTTGIMFNMIILMMIFTIMMMMMTPCIFTLNLMIGDINGIAVTSKYKPKI